MRTAGHGRRRRALGSGRLRLAGLHQHDRRRATTIPELPENDDPGGRLHGPPKQAFDATAIVGESSTWPEAPPQPRAARCAVAKDGKPLALTQDFRPDRINVAIENGEVTKIVNIG